MIILPGDLDDLERLTFESVKAAYKNGLSVFRECASDEDIRFLAEDRLYVKKGAKARTIHGFIQLSTSEVRQLEHLETVGRICCIYDQTVKRKFDPDLPHVPSHAAIFQRSLPAETENKKNKLQKACEVLFHYMKEKSRWIDVGSFRDGLFVDLNEASLAGKYIYEPPG